MILDYLSKGDNMNIEFCTACDKEINKLGFAVNIDINTYAEDVSIDKKIFKSIPNGTMKTTEVLCKECFDKFVKATSALNNKLGD